MKLSLKENKSNVTNVSQESIGNVIAEITDMCGYCDCEVLLNYHEDYDID